MTKGLAKGGPSAITHKDITRYFMTIPEAARLVIAPGVMAEDRGSSFDDLRLGKTSSA